MTSAPEFVPHLSYSQLSSYLQCGARYYYERLLKVPQRPSWAQVGGSAVHKLTENLDLTGFGVSDVTLDLNWDTVFESEIREAEERSEYPRAEFATFGRASKAWPNKEDFGFWNVTGPEHVEKWKSFRAWSGWEIYADDDGRFGIELDFLLDFDGQPVRGIIDRVMVKPTGELVVVDIKTGSREPSDPGQLGLYAEAVERKLGVRPGYGGFWMSRKGTIESLWDLSSYTSQRLTYEYGAIQKMRSQNLYLAHSGPLCGSCSARDFCPSQGGKRASEVTQPWEIA